MRVFAAAAWRRLCSTLWPAKSKAENYSRLYWLAETNNEAAQKLYETFGYKLDFTFHVLPL